MRTDKRKNNNGVGGEKCTLVKQKDNDTCIVSMCGNYVCLNQVDEICHSIIVKSLRSIGGVVTHTLCFNIFFSEGREGA